MTSLSVAFGAQIAAAAARHHLDPRLLAAVAAQETGGPGRDSGRNVVGDGGHGHGLFQIDDRYHAFARGGAAMDPAANADYAAGILASNLHRYGGDVQAALSAYNAGSPTATGTRTDWGDGKPLGYAASVLRHFAHLAGAAAPEQAHASAAAPAGAAAGPGAASAAEDPRELAELVNALQFAASRLGGSCPAPVPHAPLPRADERALADAAPSAVDAPAVTDAPPTPSQPDPSA